MNYGLQMYSVRDLTPTDYDAALKAVAEMGYKKVETAGLFNNTPEEIAAMLKKYDLECCSTHTGWDLVFNHLDETIEMHKKLGCKDIIIPSIKLETKEDLDYSINEINRVQPIIEAAGLRLHYHNHSKEFWKNQDGQIPEEELANRTKINFEIDTFWAFNAGLDPIEVLKKYADRIFVVHLKDGISNCNPEAPYSAKGKSLGLGKAPVLAVRQYCIEHNISMVVESEGLEPTGLEEVKRCIDFLKEQDAKDGQ